jgi:hypothetical protein
MIKNLAKLPKRKITIDELLDNSDMAAAIEHLVKLKPDLSAALFVTFKADGTWSFAPVNLSNQAVIYYMEQIKLLILDSDFEQDCDECEA